MQIEWVAGSQGPAPDAPENVVVTVPTMDSLMTDIAAHFEQGRGFSLATLNLDHVVKLADDAAFLDAYRKHSHVTADGNPIVWLSKLARRPVSLLAGADLIAPLAQLAGKMDVPVALLGSTQDTLDAAASALQDRHPGLRVVLCIAPPMGFDPEGALADSYITQLNDAGVGLCFLALGAPKQELLAAYASTKAPKTGFVSIGAGLDFIAAKQTRAPAFMRMIAAEWLWRMMTNPKRLAARYMACFAVLPRLFRSAMKARRANASD